MIGTSEAMNLGMQYVITNYYQELYFHPVCSMVFINVNNDVLVLVQYIGSSHHTFAVF